MYIFKNLQMPFQKVILPRKLLRRYQEVEALCYEPLALEFLTEAQKTKARAQRDPTIRSAYIRERFEDNLLRKKSKRLEPGSRKLIPQQLEEIEQWQSLIDRSTPEDVGDIYEETLYKMLIQEGSYADTERPRVALVVTGGTGFCRKVGSLEPTLPVDNVLDKVPFAKERYNLKVFDQFRIDSSRIKPNEQQKILEAVCQAIEDSKPDSVVVAHGTDTMISTAHALSLANRWPVPVVLTGAMIEGERPESDIFNNLRHALFFSAAPLRPGVYVSFGGRLYEGTRVSHPRGKLERAKEERGEGAFTSIWAGKAGECGRFYSLDEMRTKKLKPEAIGSKEPTSFDGFTNLGLCPRVLDPRLEINDDHKLWSTAYEAIHNAVERAEAGEISLKPDYSRPSKQMRIDGRPRVRGITLYPESAPLLDQIVFPSHDESDGIVDVWGRDGVYLRTFSGNLSEEDSKYVLELLYRGIPVVVGSKVHFESVEGHSPYAAADELRSVEELLIYPAGMTEDMTVAKLSIIMGEVVQAITKIGRTDLEEPRQYLRIIKSLMERDFVGEMAGDYSDETLAEAVERTVSRTTASV